MNITYPEHERLAAMSAEISAIEGFLAWMTEQREPRVWLCGTDTHGGLYVLPESLRDLILAYLRIDSSRLTEEIRAMLTAVREAAAALPDLRCPQCGMDVADPLHSACCES